MRRIPLWLTLVPLVAAIGLYWLLWSGWAKTFERELAGWLPGAAIGISGFPYRIEADVVAPRLSISGRVGIDVAADHAIINRGPWQPDLTIIRSDRPRLSIGVGPGLQMRVNGASALTSVHRVDGQLARLSNVIESARLRLGYLSAPIAADGLELHLRELLPAATAAKSPRLPARGELVIEGERLRIGGGDALTLATDLLVTGAARLTDYDRWTDGGTVEVSALTLADAHGEFARVAATLVPLGRSGLRIAGTVDTLCPATVAAAFAGLPPPRELRLRTVVRLAFEGSETGLHLVGLPADLATRPRRGQLPPCPIVRGRLG